MIKEKKKIITRRKVLVGLAAAAIIALVLFFYLGSWLNAGVSFIISFFLAEAFFIIKAKLDEASEVSKMEAAFPDFIQLMASNLRAGMTVDKALLISSRKEFAPLDKEITRLGKDLVTGKDISVALSQMSSRVNSEKIKKTITLIISGIKSGGNLAVLLEQTSSGMRERNFVEKRAASNVLMYIIFIFFAAAIGAPALFALSSVLVEILTSLLSTLPQIETNVSLPFTLTSINISLTFITYFSVTFIIVTNLLASLVLGLVSKGEEKEGLKYFMPLTILSLAVFFVVRFVLGNYFSGFFS